RLPGAWPPAPGGVERPAAIEPTRRHRRLPEPQGFRKPPARRATRLKPERPKAIAAPFAPADHRISRDHALPCIHLNTWSIVAFSRPANQWFVLGAHGWLGLFYSGPSTAIA